MYIPEFNRVEDRETALAFMRANPFAILVSNTDDGPFATHLPVVVAERDGNVSLRAHVAQANPHWKVFEQEQQVDSLVIFHGPHAYISPALYELRESVPTWNYATVHAYGRGKILSSDDDKQQVLAELIAQFAEDVQAFGLRAETNPGIRVAYSYQRQWRRSAGPTIEAFANQAAYFSAFADRGDQARNAGCDHEARPQGCRCSRSLHRRIIS